MIAISFVNKQSLCRKEIKYGQILLIKKKSKSDPLELEFDLDLDIQLITKPLNDLEAEYGVQLPTSGVKLPQKVETLLHGMQKKHPSDCHRDLQRYYQFRQLLIARKMSQLVAKTWLDSEQMKDPEDKEKFPIIRKLILLSNEFPKIEQDEMDALKHRFASEYKPEDESEIILPGRLNWSSAYLNLLLAGQAYLQKDDGTLSRLHEPILSTFEAVNLYAFKLVFDEFVAQAQELFSPGNQPVPPYYLWTFPYPPRSRTDEFSLLNKNMIGAWAYAEDDKGKLPFYRRTANDEIEGVEYVYPPYPYMAGSH